MVLGGVFIAYALYVVTQWSQGYIDFGDGNYMYIAWRMAMGNQVYREILAPQPPCHLYTGMLIYRLASALGAEAQALYAFRAFSLVLHLLTAGLVVVLARYAWRSASAGVLAAIFFLWFPVGHWWSLGYQSEPLEVFFLLAMMACALREDRSGDIAAGCLASLAALTNATAAPFLLALIVFMLWRAPRRALRMLLPCLALTALIVIPLQISTQGGFLDNAVFNQVGTFPTGNPAFKTGEIHTPELVEGQLATPEDDIQQWTATQLLQRQRAITSENLADLWNGALYAETTDELALLPAPLAELHRTMPAGMERVRALRAEIEASFPHAIKRYSPGGFFLGYAYDKIVSQGWKILKLEGLFILLSLAGMGLFVRRGAWREVGRGGLLVFCIATYGAILYVTKGGTVDYIFSLTEPAVAILAAGCVVALWQANAKRAGSMRMTTRIGTVIFLILAFAQGLAFHIPLRTEQAYEFPEPGVQGVVNLIETNSSPNDRILAPPFYAFMARRALWEHFSELFIWNMKYYHDRMAVTPEGEGWRKIRAMSAALRGQHLPLVILEMGQTGRVPEVQQALYRSYRPLLDGPIYTLNTELGVFVPVDRDAQ